MNHAFSHMYYEGGKSGDLSDQMPSVTTPLVSSTDDSSVLRPFLEKRTKFSLGELTLSLA